MDERSVVIQKNVGAALRTRYSALEETEGKREAFEVMEDGELRKGRTGECDHLRSLVAKVRIRAYALP